jgi:protease-4
MLIMAAMSLLAGGVAAFRYAQGGGGDALDESGDKLAVVRIEGIIDDSEDATGWINTLRGDDSVLGVLVRVNCPGGAVAPSQEIFSALRRLAEAKPVVASMASVAASGGYYVSAPADLIVANPSTLTGSIGVIMELANLEGLFDKLGIKRQALTSGKLKDAGSPFRAMTSDDRAYLNALLTDIHEQFLADVASARGMEIEALRPIADGRALTGNQALEAGLVDRLGGYDDALEELRAMCNAPADIPVVEQPEEPRPLLQRILGELHLTIHSDLPPEALDLRLR